MAVGDKNSLGSKENLPEYDFAVSPKKGFHNFFPKLQKVYSLFSKKKGLHQNYSQFSKTTVV